MAHFDLPEKFELSVPVNQAELERYNHAHPDSPILEGSRLGAGGKYALREIRGQDCLVWETTRQEWTSVVPPARFDFPQVSDLSMFNLIMVAVFF